jgi:hypothetical protein
MSDLDEIRRLVEDPTELTPASLKDPPPAVQKSQDRERNRRSGDREGRCPDRRGDDPGTLVPVPF